MPAARDPSSPANSNDDPTTGPAARLEALETANERLHRRVQRLRKALGRALSDRTRYRRLFEFAPAAYVITNPSGIIREANAAFARLVNHRPEYVIGKPLPLFAAPACRRTLYELLAGTQPHPFVQALENVVFPAPEGDRVASLTVAPMFAEPGQPSPVSREGMRPTGFCWLFRDLTLLQQAEHGYLRQKNLADCLVDTNRRKDEFLATLAHELRNPLAPIRNAVELMRRAKGDATLMERARAMMERQVGQMVRLVDDLLDIARITTGKLQLRQEPVELAAVVQSAIEASRPLIDAQAHQFTVLLPSEPIRLDADPIRLAQVFSNLLNNAAKYTEKGGHIWLTAERQDHEVVVTVRDTGIGIAADHLPRLFDMFSQVAPALERSQGGLGIGLALVRGLVELHGGKVEARSAGPGKGSEFTVHLAVVDPPVQTRPEPSGDAENSSAGPHCRILVADDLQDSVESLSLMLRLAGHEVQAAHDGLEAVQATATFRPDVVLLDIGMPKVNGYEAARRIRQQPWGKNMVLIALTGWGQEEDKQRTFEAGFDYHLTKPVEPAALEQLLAGCQQAR
jgi:PAS domain S-box-containing protein